MSIVANVLYITVFSLLKKCDVILLVAGQSQSWKLH